MTSVLVFVMTLLAAEPSARAAWTIGGVGSAGGAAAVMPTGGTPLGSVSGAAVTITWPTARFPDGAAIAGYVISRINASTGTATTVGTGCSGVITTTSCTEQRVAPGSWLYTDTPVQLSWTGTASLPSPPATVALG